MFNKSPEIDFSKIGLIEDTPAHKLQPGSWTESLNIRSKDGSVQGVEAFLNNVNTHDTDSNLMGRKVLAITQFTPAGTDDLVLAYIVEGVDSKCYTIVLNTTTMSYNNITNVISDQSFTYNSKYQPQIFVFNEILIINPANDAPPQYTDASTSSGSLQEITNWNTIDDNDGQPLVARILRPFNNRLIAMNILEEHLSGTQDDVYLPVDFLWSSTIHTIASLSGVEWTASSVNTAGDAFMTQSPGKIIDGLQLGPYFMCYKDDAVIQVRETGDAFVLSFDTIFEDDGLYTSGCVTSIGNNQHIVLGNYGLYIHDGQTQKVDVANGIIQESFYNDVKPEDKDKTFVFKQTRDNEVWFCYSSKDNAADSGCDKAYVFNYETKIWHKRDIPSLISLTETELKGSISIYGGQELDNLIQFLTPGTFISDGYLIQKESNLGTSTFEQVSNMFPISEENVHLSLTGSVNINETVTYNPQLFTPLTSHKLDLRVTGRYLNLKIQMNGNNNPKLTTVSFNLKGTSRR